MRNRVQEMEQTQTQVNGPDWQKMNEEINQPTPSRHQIGRQAKEMDQMMSQLQNQYQSMGTALEDAKVR